MSSVASSIFSRTSGAFNQLQQRLNDNLSLENLQGFTKQLEGQFPQVVNDALPNWGDNGQSANTPSSPTNPTANSILRVPTPAYLAYYGYGRPLGAFYQPPQRQSPQSVPRMDLLSRPMPAVQPYTQPLATPLQHFIQPVIQPQTIPLAVGYAAPIGYTGRVQSQTGPAPSQWYS